MGGRVGRAGGRSKRRKVPAHRDRPTEYRILHATQVSGAEELPAASAVEEIGILFHGA